MMLSAVMVVVMTGCFGSKASLASGGEVTGTSGRAFTEPTPHGMTLIKRGHLKMGIEGFWMDEHEVTNSMYRQFVNYVRDSILRERLADPAYGGDESYKIEEDKNGDPVPPHLNWKKALPRKPNEDEQRAFESLYVTNPVTGEKALDWRQMNYRYEIYDYTEAAKRKYRPNFEERVLNTDMRPTGNEQIWISKDTAYINDEGQIVTGNEQIWISKDTAYINDEGQIVRETINRQYTGPWDFLNTYIVNIYPDTTCWVNDFPNAENESYMRYYFSNAAYNDYPVVGVTWEQANAFCAWRTEYLLRGLGPAARFVQRYRLPTEAEWEYAARGKDQTEFPWENEDVMSGNGCFYANFKPDNGNYTKDGNLITSRVGIYSSNSNGLYDMAGNVAEWCSTIYTEAGVESMNDINPQLKYRHQSPAQVQCRQGRPLSSEEKERQRRFVEGPRELYPFRLAYL